MKSLFKVLVIGFIVSTLTAGIAFKDIFQLWVLAFVYQAWDAQHKEKDFHADTSNALETT